jgi:DNA invertase Pin-like site-specific DNA recombinase
MDLIGYARVSTPDQDLTGQIDALRLAGCHQIFSEVASGGDDTRPELARALREVTAGKTLVVVKIDRLARSVRHLVEIIDDLAERKVLFRSLSDPIETGVSSGRLMLQVLGSVAEFERSLIRERTLSGLKVSQQRGKVAGNPLIRAGDADALKELSDKLKAHYRQKILGSYQAWLPIVDKLRPLHPWPTVVEAVNKSLDPGVKPFTQKRLVRAVTLLVAEKLAEGYLLAPASKRPRKKAVSARNKAVQAVSLILAGRPKYTLRQLADALTTQGYHPPRGGASWSVSAVRNMVKRANAAGPIKVLDK